ncbi:hypothetical protein BP5796_04398 [Coleophoma crateriformis]|uniref:Kinetochore protein fta4 n=1 Tax=Coleophoma crateriformis TaxID=565419 RepID=A0A3D8S976_9HELO|nr:hypothetical protein BP5796_04398 [Coleophoma crateriformis]
MTSTSAPTIIDLKTSFLRSQILTLSKPLKPSPAWEASYTSAREVEEEHLPRRRAVDESIQKVNASLKQHNRLAFPPQAQRHVAEQIDKLYWRAGEREREFGCEAWAERGVDYRRDDIIAQLPPIWSAEAESVAPEQAAQYTSLQARLVTLSEKRNAARQRLEEHRRLKELLSPFQDTTKLQENLVTRNGEVEKELEKMRTLMMRVERGVGTLEKAAAGDDMEIDFEEAEKKVRDLIVGGS